jgi:hypothetical protein
MAEQIQQKQSIYERARAIGANMAKQQVQERSMSRSEQLGQLKPSNTPQVKQQAQNDNVQGRQLGGRGRM